MTIEIVSCLDFGINLNFDFQALSFFNAITVFDAILVDMLSFMFGYDKYELLVWSTQNVHTKIQSVCK